MKIRIQDVFISLGLIVVLLLFGCGVAANYISGVTQDEILNKKMYLSTNLHADRGPGILYSVNYQVIGELLNWGTPVIIKENESKDSGQRSYYLTNLNNKRTHDFFFHQRTNKYISDNNYFNEILTEDISILEDKIKNLSDIDQQGIKRGVALIGMSKEGVKISIGIPPIFANKDPETSKGWSYWYDKRRQFAVNFDENDKVASITGYYLSK